MDSRQIGQKLKTLRESRFPDKAMFIKAVRARGAKLDHGAIDDVENADEPRWLRVDRLKAWVEVCGSTLPEFFAEFETKPVNDKSTVQISVQRANKKLHDKLEDILNGGGDAAAWISGNVTVFHNDHVRKHDNARKRRE